MHHFVAAGAWDAAPLEKELLVQADRLVGGSDAMLVIDDTAMPKKGKHSVGVAAQHAFSVGQDRQLPDVGVTDARTRRSAGDVGLAPFPSRELGERRGAVKASGRSGRIPHGTDQAGDRARGDRPRDRGWCALRLCAGGCRLRAERAVSPGANGSSKLAWAVGIPRHLKVYPLGVRLDSARCQRGRPRRRLISQIFYRYRPKTCWPMPSGEL